MPFDPLKSLDTYLGKNQFKMPSLTKSNQTVNPNLGMSIATSQTSNPFVEQNIYDKIRQSNMQSMQSTQSNATGFSPEQQAQYNKTLAMFSNQQPVNVDTTSPVTTQQMSNSSVIKPSTLNISSTGTDSLSVNTASAAEQAQNELAETTPTPLTAREKALKSYTEGITTISGKGAETTRLQEEQDITGKTKAINDINKKIITRTSAFDKQIKELEKNPQGLTETGLNARVNELTKMRNEEIATYTMEKALALGDLETANNIVDTAIKAKYEPLEQQLNAWEKMLGFYQNDMSESEKFEAQQKYQETKDTVNYLQGLQTAAINDANSAGDSKTASAIMRLNPSSTTFQNDLANLQANIKKVSSGAFSGMTSGQASMLNTIAQAYRKSPLIAASNRTPVLSNSIQEAKADPKNGAKQLSLVYSYVQALDTYQSAVREGELSLVNSIDSKVGQLSNYVQQITSGQIVRPEVVNQIAGAAENIVNTINAGAQRAEQDFASQANVVGLGDAWNQYIGGFEKTYKPKTSDLSSRVQSAGYDYEAMRADGYSDAEIEEAINQ